MAARWVVDIADERDLRVTWEPISLLIKNQTATDSPFYARVDWTLGLLRVMESVRVAEGDAAVGDMYFEATTRIHHHKQTLWPAAEALTACGLDTAHAAAVNDPKFDAEVRRRMDQGLALVGTDVGTPILAWRDGGREVGIFGPVITRIPESKRDRLRLWDAVRTMTELDVFWELKRTRTEAPDFGQPLR